MQLFDRIEQTAAFIKEKIASTPQIGIILGSGLGGMTDLLVIETEIPYTDIPGFPASTVQGHSGKLLFGKLGNKHVMLMAGRFHYYEGYSMEEITFPVRVMKALGVETLMVSNAAGGLNSRFKIGDIMIIKDHINLFPEHPLRGANDERLGTRFPDMSEPYDQKLINTAKYIAKEQGLHLHLGVYIGLQGPTFETPAEYQWLHTIGGDTVGMSTVPEVIVARHAGMRVFAASIVTDIGLGKAPVPITHEEVLEAAAAAAPKLAALVAELAKHV
jgi:purine-nucleoside phosphorylase